MVKVPSGWTKKKLEEVARIQTGIAKGKKSIEEPITLPYLRVANVQDGYLDLSEIKKIIISKEKLHRYLLQDGDVLLTEGGDYDKLGRGTIWNGQISPCLHQNHVFAVRIDQGALLSKFFAYQASSSYGKRYFLSCAKQTTNLASINSSQLKKYPVLFPRIPEQKRIVEILEVWDRAIALTEQLITAKRIRKRGILSNIANRSYSNKLRFGQFVRLAKEKFNPGVAKNNYPCIELEHIESKTGKITGSVSSNSLSSLKSKFCSKDVLFGKLRPYLCKYASPKFKGVCSTEIWVLRSNPKLCMSRYLFYLVQTNKFMVSANKSSGSKMPRSDWNLVSECSFSLPTIQEQIQILTLLDSLDYEVNLLESLKKKYKTQKQGLMQKLLTGQWPTPQEATK